MFDCLQESYLPVLFPCSLCIANALTDEQLVTFEVYLSGFGLTLETYCALFVDEDTIADIINDLNGDLGPNGQSPVDLTEAQILALAECIFAALNDEETTTTVQQSIQQQSMDHHHQLQPAQQATQQQSMAQQLQQQQIEQQQIEQQQIEQQRTTNINKITLYHQAILNNKTKIV